MKIRETICISTFLFLCLSFLLFGCENNTNQVSVPNYATGDNYLLLVDDSYIFMRMDNGQTTYFRQFLTDGKLLELGKIDNFLISTKDSVLLDNSIFFMASTQHSDKIKTSLYKIDLNENTLSELIDDTACGFDAYPFPYQNNIAIAKYYYEDNNIRSCIEIYNLSDGTTSTILSKDIDGETLNGSIILRAYNRNEQIATLIEFGQGKSSPLTNIDLYDSNAQLIETISIEDIKSYIMESRVYQMQIIDNYIFMSNYSNYSIFGKIEYSKIIPLLQERYLEYAGGTSHIILFLRGGNTIFRVDSKTGNTEELHLNFDKDYVIRTAIANDKDILLVLKSEENNNESIQYLTLNQLFM